MCPSFSVYYNGVTPAGIVIKSVARPAAAGFVRCPPITCPLPPIWEIGSFCPSAADKTRASQDASRCSTQNLGNPSKLEEFYIYYQWPDFEFLPGGDFSRMKTCYQDGETRSG